MTRTPVVSGQFYPDNSSDLKIIVEEFRPSGSNKISAKGIVFPS